MTRAVTTLVGPRAAPTGRVGNAPRVVFAGALGTGNLGNDASLEVAVDAVRRVDPGTTLGVITYGGTAGEVCGVPCTPFVDTQEQAALGRMRAGARILGAAGDLRRTVRLLHGVQHVVVPGMGVLEERLGGGPGGFPLALATLAVAARLTGAELHLLAVGADLPTRAATRQLNSLTTRLATSRSWRDEQSREALSGSGTATSGDPVVPDLAFALDVPDAPAPTPGRIGVGVIRYHGSADDPGTGRAAHLAYIDALGRLVTGLLSSGHAVTLLVGDASDEEVFAPVRAAVAARHHDPGRLETHVSTSLTDLVCVMSGCEVVVASRYHNIVAAVLATRPVISWGYGPKHRALLTDIGLAHQAHEIDALDVPLVLDQVARARTTSEETSRHLQGVRQHRSLVVRDHLADLVEGWTDTARASRRPSERCGSRS